MMVYNLSHKYKAACHVERSETSLTISSSGNAGEPGTNLRWKAWPRELRPLRCSFVALTKPERMIRIVRDPKDRERI